jgi:MFS family permease
MRGWLVALMANAVLAHTAVTMARPMISYRAVELGAGAVGVGVLGAVFALLPLVLALRLGGSVDRRGSKPFVFHGSLLTAVAAALLAVAESTGLLVVATALLGVGQLFVLVASQALIGGRSHGLDAERNFARYTLAVSVGQFLGPLTGGLAAGSQGGLPRSTGAAFLLSAAFAVGSALLVAGWAAPGREWLRPPRREKARAGVLSLLRTPGMTPVILASSTLLASVDVMVVFLPVLGEEQGLSPVTVGALLSARAAATVCSRLLVGPLLRLLEPRRLLLASLYSSAVGFVWLTFATSQVAVMAVLLVVLGLTLGVGQPLTMAWVARRAPEDRVGLAMSLRVSGNRFTQVAVPAALGPVVGALGAASVFALLSVTLALSAVAITTRG